MSHEKRTRESDGIRYQFTLTLSATELTDDISNAIYALELDEALVGESSGCVYIDFDIAGPSFADAILGAIKLVENALPDVNVTGVHPPGEDAIEGANLYLKARKNPVWLSALNEQV